tara:strand:+ start:6925 stop:7983 length:1059 start_codon:yes stop_codon:yes gene_type:complete
MSEATENTEATFEAMPGADPAEAAEAPLDLNFGLGEEEAEEGTEAETEAEVETESEAEEEVENAPDESDSEDQSEGELQEEEADSETEEQSDDGEQSEDTAEVEESTKEPEKKPMVPKSRLDEVLAKQKALQKQLDDMKAAQEVVENAPEEYDFANKEVEYQSLLLDGEADKAAALRQEIRKAEREQIAYEMRQEMTQTVTQNQQATALQTAASELEASFPVFDQNAAEYNAEYTQEVIDLRDAFITQGHGPVEALGKAANFVIKSNDLVGTVGEEGSTLASKKAPTSQDEVAKKRAEVSKKLKAAEAQPPELPGESSADRGEKALDISTMSEEEFKALPPDTLKRLRGDII